MRCRARPAHGSRVPILAQLLGDGTGSGNVLCSWNRRDRQSRVGSESTEMRVTPALSGTAEALFHESDLGDFFLRLARDGSPSLLPAFPLLARAIGVIYSPRTERQSRYFLARVADQFDDVYRSPWGHAITRRPSVQMSRRGDIPGLLFAGNCRHKYRYSRPAHVCRNQLPTSPGGSKFCSQVESTAPQSVTDVVLLTPNGRPSGEASTERGRRCPP
ncbi:erythromycin esterase family protein [[Mycobacterium] appelbergii]|uniref:erythromycin esterase family protein n=1 Tax=[Mycobacterium] appelbergii TaxID=2939269 RepID=UPI003977D714